MTTQPNAPCSPALQKALLRMEVMAEMAAADGYVSADAALQSARTREIYEHYSDCFLRVLARWIAKGECVLQVKGEAEGRG